eukprot:COSAG01_NODE_10858_length_2067_cov_1.277439_1_plen_136_part_00
MDALLASVAAVQEDESRAADEITAADEAASSDLAAAAVHEPHSRLSDNEVDVADGARRSTRSVGGTSEETEESARVLAGSRDRQEDPVAPVGLAALAAAGNTAMVAPSTSDESAEDDDDHGTEGDETTRAAQVGL